MSKQVVHDGKKETEYDGVYYGKDKNTPLKRKILYLCNQKKCGEACSAKNGECERTTDVRYAAHYMNEPPNKTLEKHFNKTLMVLDEPYDLWEEKKMETKIITESALRAFMYDVGLPETMDVRVIFDPIVQVWDVIIKDNKSGVEIHEQTPVIDRDFKEKIAGTILHLQEGIAYE